MKSFLKLAFILVITQMSCEENDFDSDITIREKLNSFIINAKKTQVPGEKLTPKIVEYVKSELHLTVIDKNSLEYSILLEEYFKRANLHREVARVASCDMEITMVHSSVENCNVFVIEYGSGCDNAGCIGNDWSCWDSDWNFTWSYAEIC
jgi:hypothetical protein